MTNEVYFAALMTTDARYGHLLSAATVDEIYGADGSAALLDKRQFRSCSQAFEIAAAIISIVILRRRRQMAINEIK